MVVPGSFRSFEKLVGLKLGRYFLERLIEENELGPVFLVRRRAEARTYLLRILTTPAKLSPEARIVYLGYFQQLAKKITALHHPNILPLLDYGNTGAWEAGSAYQGLAYLVLPHLPLLPLSNGLIPPASLDLLTVGRYLDEIVTALEYAHQQGVLHRNLTIDSIFSIRDERLVIADFGVMRMLELSQQEGEEYPFLGSGEGTAPEQFLGISIDTYTDMYALGALLYRLLTGSPVFAGKTRDEIAQQHLHSPVPPLVGDQFIGLKPDLFLGLNRLIATALAKDALQRFRSPGELADTYHQIVGSNGTRVNGQAGTANQGDRGIPGRGRDIPGRSLSLPRLYTDQDHHLLRAAHPGDGEAPRLGGDEGSWGDWETQNLGVRPQTRISRRRALLLLGAGGGVAVIGATAFLGARFLNGSFSHSRSAPTPTLRPTCHPSPQDGNVAACVSDLPLNSARKIALPNSKHPGLLIHLPDNRFVAFDARCTHAGCAVDYIPASKLLVCPCHESVFDPARNAAVVKGPAQKPLAPVKIKVNADGTISVV